MEWTHTGVHIVWQVYLSPAKLERFPALLKNGLIIREVLWIGLSHEFVAGPGLVATSARRLESLKSSSVIRFRVGLDAIRVVHGKVGKSLTLYDHVEEAIDDTDRVDANLESFTLVTLLRVLVQLTCC